MFWNYKIGIYYIFLLELQRTTPYVENRSVKRANSHLTICTMIHSYSYSFLTTAQPTFTSWKLTIERLEQSVEYVQSQQ